MYRMPICDASSTGSHDVLPPHDVQALHQEESEGASYYATEEKAVANAAAGSQVRWLGSQGAPL